MCIWVSFWHKFFNINKIYWSGTGLHNRNGLHWLLLIWFLYACQYCKYKLLIKYALGYQKEKLPEILKCLQYSKCRKSQQMHKEYFIIQKCKRKYMIKCFIALNCMIKPFVLIKKDKICKYMVLTKVLQVEWFNILNYV
jgi:hypothetical protein